MAFDETKPADNRDWDLAAGDIRTNNSAIETAVDYDHDFTTGSTQTGKHTRMTIPENAGDETGLASHITIWDKAGLPVYRNGTGTVQTLASIGGSETFTNKTFTNPVLNGTLSGTAFLDEDDMASDSAVAVASQQSIKAYVDAQVGSNNIIARSRTDYSGVSTGTTVMIRDDTIPQNTEGDQYMAIQFTPASATNRLVIEVMAQVANGGTQQIIMALFQDTTANALFAVSERDVGVNEEHQINLKHEMVAGTTSQIEFKIRIGSDQAATTTFNGYSGGRLFGDIPKSYIAVTEYAA